ncbi:MAG: ATP-binding protein [Candidatus Micrarchaeia archaeon]
MSIRYKITKMFNFGKKDPSGIKITLGKSRYLLSRPIKLENIHGTFTFVRRFAWKKHGGTLSISPSNEANPHMLIFGMSGQGKSSLLRSMMADIRESGAGVIVFDAHNEHEKTVSSIGGTVVNAANSGINIFALEGSTVGERISELSSIFRQVYSLGYLQAIKLEECMWYAYRKCGASSRSDTRLLREPVLRDIMAELSIFIKMSKSSSEQNSLMHIRSRLSQLYSSFGNTGSMDLGKMESGITSFSLAGLRNEESQLIYINELLRRLYARMKSREKEKGVGMYIIIDEAQQIINDSDSQIIKKITEEGRKYGIGVIIATHMASRLPREIVANASTFITFYSREPQEVNYVANVMSEGMAEKAYEVKKMLQKLRQNEAMVLSCAVREPCVVETPRAIFSPVPEAVQASARKPVLVSSSELIEGMQNMYLKSGDKTEHWVMDKNASTSIEHEVSVKKIAEALYSLSIKASIINNSNGPDLVAYHDGKKIAIEYETGRKKFSDTARMIAARKKDYDAVIIVVNDAAYKFYKNYFEDDSVCVIPSSSSTLLDSLRNAIKFAATVKCEGS